MDFSKEIGYLRQLNGSSMEQKHIAVLVGSLRKQAFSRWLALAAQKLAPSSLALEIVEISDLPFFNQDLEDPEKTPPAWTAFREKMKTFDGFLFITPEYNRSVPAVLKNAVDVGSRPRGESVWSGKPAGLISQSPGAMGGFGANHHLRQSLSAVNVAVMPQPEAYLGGMAQAFDDKGELVAERTKEFLKKYLEALALWIQR